MQKQTSALQTLSKILHDAVLKTSVAAQGSKPAIPILLKYINALDDSSRIIDFFALLCKAREEIGRMKDKESSYSVIEKLNDYFIKNSDKTTWNDFAKFIDDGNYIILLKSLADHYHTQNPTIFLEPDFLDELKNQFNSLLDEIIDSNLSNNLKRFLTKQIENILYAIRRYSIDGTEGLEKAVKLFFSDLAIVESHLDNKDKKNPIYKNCQTWVSTLLISLFTPSAYDVIGVFPTINDYYIPKIEELVKYTKEISGNIGEISIQEVLEKSLNSFNKQPQKSLPGKEQKSLPSAKAKKEPPLKIKANLED